jgi:hypothetical protein
MYIASAPTFVVYGFGPFLKDTPLPIYETIAIQQLFSSGYLTPTYQWQVSAAEYRKIGDGELTNHFIINHLYYASFNLTLLQFGHKETRKNKNTYPLIYWYRGPLEGFQIGCLVKKITFSIIESPLIAPLNQRYINLIK